jgi:trehalose-phosphatase
METGRSHVTVARSARPGKEPADPRELAQEIVQEARARGGLVLFTDYEGTLSSGVPDRRGVGLPLLVRGALVALATTPATRVVVISRYDACDLEAEVDVAGVTYAGYRGLQIRGAGMTLCHPVAEGLREALPVLAQKLSQRLAPLAGVEVEIKELGVTVHVRRMVPSTVPAVIAQAEELRRTSAGEFRVWPSESAVDLVPDVGWRKGSGALWILEQWAREGRGRPAVVYLGDDDADEDAYLALRGHGHAVRVGPSTAESAASCWVVDHAAAIDLLARIAFGWSVRSSNR